ncbi:Mediator of RNA polymerase II transcription subunit 15a [Heracleum sosnowskyi]|uniref:Mediator of RNA polymerase II transcription subunit 15a n=1 Tax=Heracleum sosnowskyi TaxID=360622 RepID=A0AAD8HJB3_9APIA|nr:Mediator of RNA polymerase II transcription subunit 15a [Heracleum sosnowskyi]
MDDENEFIFLLWQANQSLLEEIKEINSRLIDTVVDISDEDADPTATAAAKEGGEGTIVKCSYSAVALSPNLKSQYVSSQMSPIHPLRFLVPRNYPNCSPILLDKFPVEVRIQEDGGEIVQVCSLASRFFTFGERETGG